MPADEVSIQMNFKQLKKNTMKRVTLLIAVFVLPMLLFSQENKFEYTPKVKNKLHINNLLGKITLKNASGNALVIESDFNVDRPERAEGLSILGALEDNTKLGANVSEENGVVTITGITKKVQDYSYVILVPEGINVILNYRNPFANSDIAFESYKGSVEVETLSSNVHIIDCTGPFTVNSVSGNVEATFSVLSEDGPTSLASVSGLVDVSIPENTKSTVKISNTMGDVYNNLDLVRVSKKEADARKEGLNDIKQGGDGEYTLNGGGQKLLLNSVTGNIYLRKK